MSYSIEKMIRKKTFIFFPQVSSEKNFFLCHPSSSFHMITSSDFSHSHAIIIILSLLIFVYFWFSRSIYRQMINFLFCCFHRKIKAFFLPIHAVFSHSNIIENVSEAFCLLIYISHINLTTMSMDINFCMTLGNSSLSLYGMYWFSSSASLRAFPFFYLAGRYFVNFCNILQIL